MLEVLENQEIACKRRARNRSDGRRSAQAVSNSPVGSPSVDAATDEGTLAVRSPFDMHPVCFAEEPWLSSATIRLVSPTESAGRGRHSGDGPHRSQSYRK